MCSDSTGLHTALCVTVLLPKLSTLILKMSQQTEAFRTTIKVTGGCSVHEFPVYIDLSKTASSFGLSDWFLFCVNGLGSLWKGCIYRSLKWLFSVQQHTQTNWFDIKGQEA